MVFLSQIAEKLVHKYPHPDCTTLVGHDDPVIMEHEAIFELRSNSALEENGQTVSYNGYVQCFCDERAIQGDLPDQKYTDYNGDETVVCQDYMDALIPTLIAYNGVTVFIVALNYVLKITAISLISWIGYETHSELMTKITNGVFIVLFFNTGIMLTLVNANFSDISSVLGNMSYGTFYDYSPRWYATVGNTLVQTMLLNAFMPPIIEAQTSALTWFFQALDSGKWGCCKTTKYDRMYNTKSKQIYALIDLYAGPNYIIHFKYSTILNVTFVTMFYGLGLPLLFPIAFLSYFIFWATERYQLAYTYTQPPMMDDKLTINAM